MMKVQNNGKTYEYDRKTVFVNSEFHKQLKMASVQEDMPIGKVMERAFNYWKKFA
jgi:hypothetical protein